jgi:hypothetical protein
MNSASQYLNLNVYFLSQRLCLSSNFLTFPSFFMILLSPQRPSGKSAAGARVLDRPGDTC